MKNIKYILFILAGFLVQGCWDDELVPGGTATPSELQVNVTNAGGEPISGATVSLFQSNVDYLKNQNAVGSATTDGQGESIFPLKGLTPGVYYFSAESGDLRNWAGTRSTGVLTITSGTTVSKTSLAAVAPLASISGPSEVTSGKTASYSLPAHPGTYEWSVVSGENFTITTDPNLPSIDVHTAKSATAELITLQVVATRAGFEPQTLTIDVAVGAFCDYDSEAWAGLYFCEEPGYGTYAINFTQDATDPNKFFNDNFWDFAGEVYYVFNPEDETVVIPEQAVVMGGDEYVVSGSGTYDQCSSVFVVDYVVTSGGDVVDENTHTFTKQI